MGRNKRVIQTVLVLAVIVIVVLVVITIQQKNNLSTTQEAFSLFQQQVAPLQEQVKSLQQQLDTTQSNLEQAQIDVKNLKGDYEKAQAELQLYQDTGIKIYKNIQPDVNTDIKFDPVVLSYNPNVHNPTWAELMSFIKSDKTDSQTYGINLCGWFANKVFSDAEAQGIRAAFVTIDFQEGIGHALNAFNTTDKGLVYIDCTGEELHTIQLFPLNQIIFTIGNIGGNDKIAYVQKGKPLGLISVGTSYGLNYSDYLQWQLDVENMKRRFDSTDISEVLSQLENESNQKLGSFWEPDSSASNIVESIEIYW